VNEEALAHWWLSRQKEKKAVFNGRHRPLTSGKKVSEPPTHFGQPDKFIRKLSA